MIASTSCNSGSQPTSFQVVRAATPPGLSVRWSSAAPLTGSGKAKMAREVKETSKVLEGNCKSMPFMTAVSTVVPLVVHEGVESMRD